MAGVFRDAGTWLVRHAQTRKVILETSATRMAAASFWGTPLFTTPKPNHSAQGKGYRALLATQECRREGGSRSIF